MRTDIHRQSVINPEEYQAFSWAYLGSAPKDRGFLEASEDERKYRFETMRDNGWKYSDVGEGTCQICGAHALYIVYFVHKPTGDVIRVGSTCAAKMNYCDGALFRTVKTLVANARCASEARAAGLECMKQHNLEAAWEYFLDPDQKLFEGFEFIRAKSTFDNIISRVLKHAQLSDKQWEYLEVLWKRISNWEEYNKEKEVARAAIADAPTGKATATVKILKASRQETFYGYRNVMLVQSTDGWKAHGSVPDALLVEFGDDFDAMKGKTIQFTANFERKEDDVKFAFFKRPTKVTIQEN